MNIPKYKIGDKVKIIGNLSGSSNKIGDIGIIGEIITDFSQYVWYKVNVGNISGANYTIEYELTKILNRNPNIKIL